jgi:hypothetical protein
VPGIYHGSTAITDIRLGSTAINEIRFGSTLVWARSQNRDNFDRADADDLGENWTDFGPDDDWILGISSGTARVQIPDHGLIGGSVDFRTSQMQWNVDVNDGDDGFVEAVFATRGDGFSITQTSDFKSQVWGRMSNGAWTHGVGIQAVAGNACLVKRVSNIDTQVTDYFPWQPSQPLRHTFIGNMHRLFIAGVMVASWNDSGATASKGAGYRSLGIRADGGKDFLGPRRFSPAFDYVLMG